MISPRLIYSIYENRLQKLITKENLPQHIGLIHDGHRRYCCLHFHRLSTPAEE